ncbi:putative E3 ubiquitin-protein ligase TRIML1 [Discoglossus pictus]
MEVQRVATPRSSMETEESHVGSYKRSMIMEGSQVKQSISSMKMKVPRVATSRISMEIEETRVAPYERSMIMENPQVKQSTSSMIMEVPRVVTSRNSMEINETRVAPYERSMIMENPQIKQSLSSMRMEVPESRNPMEMEAPLLATSRCEIESYAPQGTTSKNSMEMEDPNMTEPESSMTTETALISEIKRQCLNIQEEVSELLEDYELKSKGVKLYSAQYREQLNKNFENLQDLLEKEKHMLLTQSKEREEKALQVLKDRTLKLANLTYSITDLLEKKVISIKIKQVPCWIEKQIQEFKAQVEKMSEVEIELDECVSPVQLREWRGLRHFVKPVGEKLCFDPQTAHPNLIISLDFRRVRFQAFPNRVPGNAARFDPGLYVLGDTLFQSGRHYWEVDVGYKSNWILGIVRESVERKKAQELTPGNGYWILRKQQDNLYYGIGATPLGIKVKTPPMRIGICLDFFRGHLAFYDADNTNLIFELSGCPVGEKMIAFFCPGVPMREEDWCPLTLCP